MKQQEIDRAIDKGAAYLKQQGVEGRENTMELVALTLAHAGVPASEAPLTDLIERVTRGELVSTYHVALQAVLLAHVDPKKYRARIAECGQWLVDSQCSNGQWTYTGKLRQEPERNAVSGDGKSRYTLRDQREAGAQCGDNSNSQFGVLGLWAVCMAGVKVPASAFQRAERWWKADQRTDGGWGYGGPGPSYGSMTCAGVAAMSICGRGQGDPERNRGQEIAGLRWLGQHFSVKENPRGGSWLYYYLYSLERAGTITGQKLIGGKDWYQEGARFLVDNQAANGSWEESDPVIDTCFAILFLKRATASLVTGIAQDRVSVTPDDPALEPPDPEEQTGEEKK